MTWPHQKTIGDIFRHLWLSQLHGRLCGYATGISEVEPSGGTRHLQHIGKLILFPPSTKNDFSGPRCRIKVGKLVYKDQKAFSKMLIFIEICGLIAAIHVRSIASPLPPSPKCTAVVVSHQQEWQFL